MRNNELKDLKKHNRLFESRVVMETKRKKAVS